MENTNFLDIFALGFSGWGLRRGYILGFLKQLRRLIDYVTGLGVGLGLYKFLGARMSDIAHISPELTGLPAFLLSAGGAFAIVRFVRRRLNILANDVVGKFDGLYGAILGFGRNGALASGGIFAAGMAPNEGISNLASQGSLIGRTLSTLFGAGY